MGMGESARERCELESARGQGRVQMGMGESERENQSDHGRGSEGKREIGNARDSMRSNET